MQAHGDAERVLAPDRDERVDAVLLQRAAHGVGSVPALGERIGARGAEDRAAAREDAGGAGEGELVTVVAEHPGPAVAKAEEAVLRRVQAGAHDGADHGVEAGAVASAGEEADAHEARCLLPGGTRW